MSARSCADGRGRGLRQWAPPLVLAAAVAMLVGCRAGPPTAERRDLDRRTTQETQLQSRTQTVAFGTDQRGRSTAAATSTDATLDGVLRIRKSMPREIPAGQPFEYEITVTNTSQDMLLSNVVIREHESHPDTGMMTPRDGQRQPRPAEFDRQRPPREPAIRPGAGAGQPVRHEVDPQQDLDAPQDIQHGPTMQPVAMPAQPGAPGHMGTVLDGQYDEYPIGDLAPGQSRTIVATGFAPQPGSFMVCTTASYTPVVCTVALATQPQLELRKQGPESARPGEEIRWRLAVTNTGIGTARDVVILDPLPGEMRTPAGEREVRFNVGTLREGETRTFDLRTIAPGPGEYLNVARAVGEPNLAAEARAGTVVRAPRLQVSKVGPPVDYTNVGITFEIAVTNIGDMPAENVVVEDILPPQSRLISATDSPQVADGRVAWRIRTLRPGETRTFMTRVEGQQVGTFENCVVARADRLEPVRDCALVRLEGVTGLLLELVDTNDPIRIGDNEVYVIRITNQGTAPATNVGLDVEIDQRMRFVSAEGPSPFAPAPTGLSFAPLPNLPPGRSVEFRVITQGTGEGDTRLRVAMTASELERPVIAGESTRVFD